MSALTDPPHANLVDVLAPHGARHTAPGHAVSGHAAPRHASLAHARTLTTTVPREYVHRSAVSEVLLTGWRPAAGDAATPRFTVRAQWPRAHTLFSCVRGQQDPMMIVESVRQIGALLAHAEFGVPFGHHFMMDEIAFAAEPALLAAQATPTEVELRTVCRPQTRPGGKLTGMRYDVVIVREGRELGTAHAAFQCLTPVVHRRLRGERPTTTTRPLPPAAARASVGRLCDLDVLLAQPQEMGCLRWELRVDTAHPTFFDHPVDHVPGMVLLEAARQAARASAGAPDLLLLTLDSRFLRYVELDAPCWIEVTSVERRDQGQALVRVCGVQGGERVFTADLALQAHTA
ncbi:ScbA/BarX family gamma-butyrolactone biosynthesis protein [Streptomyces sp. NPDC088354]|uniref:ScbA/BarX family gamma-butyrolactone biosynthesis protein n=1 Tax=Streptomyces sp. NPDC088354 TaxID=3365856 RepID=UPI0038309A2A